MNFLKTWLNPIFSNDLKLFGTEECSIYEGLLNKIAKNSPENETECKETTKAFQKIILELKNEEEEDSSLFVEGDNLTFEEYCSIADKTFFDPLHDKTSVTNDNIISQDPVLIAEQLTLIDTVLFSKIKVNDILGRKIFLFIFLFLFI